jgi:hypothetical protein
MSPPPAENSGEKNLRHTQNWLRMSGLSATTLPIDFRDIRTGQHIPDVAQTVLTLPAERSEKCKKEELDSIEASWRAATAQAAGEAGKPASTAQLDALLDRNPKLFADLTRLPVNALAFYRPFHLEPFDRWGIYLYVDRLLSYAAEVRFVAPFLEGVSKEVLLHLVLFEIFHHEFYHHLVECAATTMEILADALGAPIPSYVEYRIAVGAGKFASHDHNPLEEALANAYAYHGLGFISRVKTGYLDALVGSYQKNLTAIWPLEGPGYRSAASYLAGAQIAGNAELLAMMLGRNRHPAFYQIAQSVMPSGYAAFLPKPDIPTYLVGTPEQVRDFHDMVPAPNDTYCHLFWPFDTGTVESQLKNRHREREEAKKAAKAASAQRR